MKILGIRHHGPGCARSLLAALEEIQPDCILIEGPVEADSLIPEVISDEMTPPIALLLHQVDKPEHSSFYPFAEYSPEWQALKWAIRKEVSVRFCDLPIANQFAIRNLLKTQHSEESSGKDSYSIEEEPTRDPFEYFAIADGYTDGEKWWNDQIEERESSPELFTAILEAVTALREELNLPESDITLKREAWMRRQMREAQKEGFENIVVICGAWHAPSLVKGPSVSSDNALLTKMPKVKIEATWSPWTNARLAIDSGYGAGVTSPGWYQHLWNNNKYSTTHWITKAARILRKENLEGSSASIIEAVRLATSLASLRGRPKPGLQETMQAIQAIFCQGDASLLRLLNKPLLIGDKLGKLPSGVAKLPLQQDIEAQQKSLRLKPTANKKKITLDLRDENPRKRSAFLHRLIVLDICYGTKQRATNKGTFKEVWIIEWIPEFAISIIDASAYGNTVEIAAASKLSIERDTLSLSNITEKLNLALLCRLPNAISSLLQALHHTAASTHDTQELMRSVIPLCDIAHYGDVRKTETSSVSSILNDLITRICIELPHSVIGLNYESATKITKLIRRVHHSISLLDNSEHLALYYRALTKVAESSQAHSISKGAAVSILNKTSNLTEEELVRHLSYALSSGASPTSAAHWIESFLYQGALQLIHQPTLLKLIHHWLSGLTEEHFTHLLPLLRRTFGQFSLPEKQHISNIISSSTSHTIAPERSGFDEERAYPAILKVAELLNLKS